MADQTAAKFGFYPSPLALAPGGTTIEPLPDLEKKVAAVTADPGIERDWIYAPSYAGKPYISRIFGLPKTHVIRHAAGEGGDHLAFLIWALSFFVGMRLTATEMGFLDATPLRPGMLVDFHASPRELSKLLVLADAFWAANRAEPLQTKRFAAAIHALFLGQYPQGLQFERFTHLYTALDACFAIVAPRAPRDRPTHTDRIEWLCNKFGMTTPDGPHPPRARPRSPCSATMPSTKLSIVASRLVSGCTASAPIKISRSKCKPLFAAC